MTGTGETDTARSVGERFPALAPLEQRVEEEKLRQALAESRAARLKQFLPSLDGEVAQDEVTAGEKPTGLGRVLALRAVGMLASDVADLAVAAVNADRPAEEPDEVSVLLTSDPSVLSCVGIHAVAAAELTALDERVTRYVEAGEPGGEGDGNGSPHDRHPAELRRFLAPAAVPLAVGAGVEALGLLSRLTARKYHVAGEEVPVDDLGFDVAVARELLRRRNHKHLTVWLDRVALPDQAPILARFTELSTRAADVEEAARTSSARAAVLDDQAGIVRTAVTALETQLASLVEKGAEAAAKDARSSLDVGKELETLRTERDEQTRQLQELVTRATASRLRSEEGLALAADIEQFLAAMTAASEGSRPPILEAARAESFGLAPEVLAPAPAEGRDGSGADARSTAASARTYVLLVRLLAGGIDRTLEQRALQKDTWTSLTGVGAEYSLLTSGGRLLAAATRTALRASSMKIGEPTSFEDERVNHPVMPTVELYEGRPATNPSSTATDEG